MSTITASIVLYNTPENIIIEAINSFLKSCSGIIYIIDNSDNITRYKIFRNIRVRYYHSPINLGFGKGHNLVINKYITDSDYHLVLNPDVRFNPDIIPVMVKEFLSDYSIGAIMPKIIYPDGSIQKLVKLIPNPVNLIARRFIKVRFIVNKINSDYEFSEKIDFFPISVPLISGCFFMARTQTLKKVGGFDERFFMYMEDVDISRRMGAIAKLTYMPSIFVIHDYDKGSYKKINLLILHIISAIKYFNKWGWFIDKNRDSINKDFINRLNG